MQRAPALGGKTLPTLGEPSILQRGKSPGIELTTRHAGRRANGVYAGRRANGVFKRVDRINVTGYGRGGTNGDGEGRPHTRLIHTSRFG